MARRVKLAQLPGTLAIPTPTVVAIPTRIPAAIPVLTFETIWEKASAHPPFNVVKTRQLLDQVPGQEELRILLEELLRRSPALNEDQLRERHGTLPSELSAERMIRLKQLLSGLKQGDLRELLPITILDDLEMRQLKELRYNANPLNANPLANPLRDPIINLADRAVLYQVVFLLLILGFTEIYRFLSTVQSPKDIFFGNPLMKRAHDKSIIDLKILKWKPNVTTGVKCKRCGEKKVLVSERQLRSADEPATVFYRCTSCDYAWRVG